MEVFKGKAIFSRIAIGPVSFYAKDQMQVKRQRIEDADAEINRYEAAKATAMEQLGELYEKAVKEVGESGAQIFEVHQMMLEDDDYNESVYSIIKTQMVNAEYAVATTGDNFSEMFAAMEDEYFRARAADMKDISERILSVLTGGGQAKISDEPSIIVADDLAPSETVQFDKSKLLGFVTRHGSSNSHTAILARTMNIPALIQIDIQESWNGKMAIIDGFTGDFYIDPTDAVMEVYQAKKTEQEERRKLLATQKGKPTVTKSGKAVKLFANIGSVSDLASVLENDAGGIGLFRSEFLYLQSDTYPTEEEQFKAYKMVAETMAGKKVIIRTLDIGADKQVDYFNLDKEENPAMGLRALRICLTRPEIFKTQLRALLRASAYGNIAIMYPMVTSVEEVHRIKEIVAEVKAELDAASIKYADVEQGVMIETPAAVIISDLLAKEVDFFSIGTNDLTQYTLAIDRQNPNLDEFYNEKHEAVLRMIEMVVDNAHKEGIWAGICGELGANMSLTERFMAMGVDELSVSPTFILPIRQIIRDYDGPTK